MKRKERKRCEGENIGKREKNIERGPVNKRKIKRSKAEKI